MAEARRWSIMVHCTRVEQFAKIGVLAYLGKPLARDGACLERGGERSGALPGDVARTNANDDFGELEGPGELSAEAIDESSELAAFAFDEDVAVEFEVELRRALGDGELDKFVESIFPVQRSGFAVVLSLVDFADEPGAEVSLAAGDECVPGDGLLGADVVANVEEFAAPLIFLGLVVFADLGVVFLEESYGGEG